MAANVTLGRKRPNDLFDRVSASPPPAQAVAAPNSGKYEENPSARVRLRAIVIGQMF
jgi:hypothetical protein